jgi:hypothetical protein
MKDRFLRIKSLGAVGDSWLANNRGDQVHAQLSGALNRKTVQDLTVRALQLLALQSGHVGSEENRFFLSCEDLTLYAFDLGPLALVAVAKPAIEPSRLFEELGAIADDFRADERFLSKHERKGFERREILADAYLDEKAKGLMGELKRS